MIQRVTASRRPLERRGLGVVFPDYALWPHLTGKISLPLNMAGVVRAECERRVAAVLVRVGLAAMAGRSPLALSSCQKQRATVAGGIVGELRVVLFDEASPNLDGNCAKPWWPKWVR